MGSIPLITSPFDLRNILTASLALTAGYLLYTAAMIAFYSETDDNEQLSPSSPSSSRIKIEVRLFSSST